MPPPAVPEEPLSAPPPMFRPPPAKRPSRFAAGAPVLSRLLAIAGLVIVALTATVVFRDAIVRTYPGLAPVYAAAGLLVEDPDPAPPHG